MKLKAYSRNNPVKHLVFHTVKRFFWLPLAVFIITVIVFFAPEIINIDRPTYIMSLVGAQNIRYIFKAPNAWGLYRYLFIGVSAFSAFVVFSFLFKKKSASVMMLTGVSRTALFLTKYLFGLVSVILPTMITFTALLATGASYVDKIGFFSDYTPYIYLMTLGIIIYSYTVASIAAALCGRKLDFFAVCGVMYFGVQGLMVFFTMMLSSFMHGFAYAARLEPLLPYNIDSLFDDYAFLSINTIFKQPYQDYPYTGYPSAEESGIDFGVYTPEIVWLIVIGILLVPLALMIFKGRNSEFDGKPNSRPVLSAVCTVIVALSASSLVLLRDVSLVYCVGGLALFVVICLAMHAFFEGSVRSVLRSFKYVLPCVAAVCIFGIAIYFDILGYSSKVPEINEVESVSITYKGSDKYFKGGSHSSGFSTNGFVHITATTLDFSSLPELTDEADIKTAIDIHKKLIEDGSRIVSDSNEKNYSDTVVYADVYVAYKLKNGKELIRCYPQMKLSTLYETLRLDDTEAYKFNRELQYRDLMRHSYEAEKGMELIYNDVKIHISDNMGSNKTLLELSPSDAKALAEALANDKRKEGRDEINHPAEECVGILWLSASHTDGENVTPNTPVCIYNNNSETLSWLAEKGFDKYFEPKYTVKAIDVFEQNYFDARNTRGWAIDKWYSWDNAEEHSGDEDPPASAVSVDEKDFDAFLKKCRAQCFMDGGNRFAVITLVNSDGEEIKVVKYVMD